ncbi:hypothetical protein GC163_19420 [bacterium]|nr:hypothetical protein [bacterium]
MSASSPTNSLAVDPRVSKAAHRLAIDFTDDDDLPARYRRNFDPSRKVRKVKDDSETEKRFKRNVDLWVDLINTMLPKIDERLAWRFVELSPDSGQRIDRITQHKDFDRLIDYMILRRDREECSHDELGRLALLSMAFQRQVERQVNKPA